MGRRGSVHAGSSAVRSPPSDPDPWAWPRTFGEHLPQWRVLWVFPRDPPPLSLSLIFEAWAHQKPGPTKSLGPPKAWAHQKHRRTSAIVPKRDLTGHVGKSGFSPTNLFLNPRHNARPLPQAPPPRLYLTPARTPGVPQHLRAHRLLLWPDLGRAHPPHAAAAPGVHPPPPPALGGRGGGGGPTSLHPGLQNGSGGRRTGPRRWWGAAMGSANVGGRGGGGGGRDLRLSRLRPISPPPAHSLGLQNRTCSGPPRWWPRPGYCSSEGPCGRQGDVGAQPPPPLSRRSHFEGLRVESRHVKMRRGRTTTQGHWLGAPGALSIGVCAGALLVLCGMHHRHHTTSSAAVQRRQEHAA